MSHLYPTSRLALLAVVGASLIACSDRNDSGREPGPPSTAIGDTFIVTSANRILSVGAISPGVTRTSVAITGLDAGETIKDVDARPVALGTAAPAVYALGSTGQLSVLGDRVTLTLRNTPPEALSQWLSQVRINARLLPLESKISREAGSPGWSGTLVLTGPGLGGTP